jgi:hypothetical protein
MGPLFPADPYHWLDANAFIHAKNGPYNFEMALVFGAGWKRRPGMV